MEECQCDLCPNCYYDDGGRCDPDDDESICNRSHYHECSHRNIHNALECDGCNISGGDYHRSHRKTSEDDVTSDGNPRMSLVVQLRKKLYKTKSSLPNHYQIFLKLQTSNNSDIKMAIEKYKSVGLTTIDLAKRVQEYSEFIKKPFREIDVLDVVCRHILFKAQNAIIAILSFDICKNIAPTMLNYGNFLVSSVYFSKTMHDSLKKRLERIFDDEVDQLLDDKFVRVFFKDADIQIGNNEPA